MVLHQLFGVFDIAWVRKGNMLKIIKDTDILLMHQGGDHYAAGSTQTRLVGIMHRQDALIPTQFKQQSFLEMCRDASYVCIIPSLICGHSYLLVASCTP